MAKSNVNSPLAINVVFYGKPSRRTGATPFLGAVTLGRGMAEAPIKSRMLHLLAEEVVPTEDQARVRNVAKALGAASVLYELTEGPLIVLRFPPREVSE